MRMKCIVELFDDAPSRHLAWQAVPLMALAARNKPRMGKYTPCEKPV